MNSGHTELLTIDCGIGIAVESREVVNDMIEHGRLVLEAHSDCASGDACDDKCELLDMHLESNFPDVSDVIRAHVVELLTDDEQVTGEKR